MLSILPAIIYQPIMNDASLPHHANMGAVINWLLKANDCVVINTD